MAGAVTAPAVFRLSLSRNPPVQTRLSKSACPRRIGPNIAETRGPGWLFSGHLKRVKNPIKASYLNFYVLVEN